MYALHLLQYICGDICLLFRFRSRRLQESTTMLFILFFVYLVHCASADERRKIIPSCSDVPGSRMFFTPVEGFLGRYKAEYCTAENNTSRKWLLKLEYYHSRNYCNSTHVTGFSHSTNSEFISKEHNCTAEQTVCMSAIFDLIFSACYSITSSFTDLKGSSYISYFNIKNNYTERFFHNNQAIVDHVYHLEDTTITWHTGVPILEIHKMEFCNQAQLNECEDVLSTNCTIRDATTLKCRLAPTPGCHRLYLTHWAPWITGVFSNQSSVIFDFCRNATSVEAPPDGAWGGWAWVGVGACLLVAGVALLARWLARALARGKLKKKVQASWLIHTHRHGEALEPPPTANPVGRSVLVLYARECAAAERAVGSLLAALREHVQGQVYDIFSPGVMALCAGAPAEWLRGVLARTDCAVLLLQSPALHALYSTHSYTNDTHKLVSPLLGRRVWALEPQYGDVLLQLALRLIAENTHSQYTYKKYYIATISALPTEILPCVVPYTRYPLPAATDLLLKDISGAPAAQHHVDQFTTCLNEFVDYARDNPDYLLDELIFTDT